MLRLDFRPQWLRLLRGGSATLVAVIAVSMLPGCAVMRKVCFWCSDEPVICAEPYATGFRGGEDLPVFFLAKPRYTELAWRQGMAGGGNSSPNPAYRDQHPTAQSLQEELPDGSLLLYRIQREQISVFNTSCGSNDAESILSTIKGYLRSKVAREFPNGTHIAIENVDLSQVYQTKVAQKKGARAWVGVSAAVYQVPTETGWMPPPTLAQGGDTVFLIECQAKLGAGELSESRTAENLPSTHRDMSTARIQFWKNQLSSIEDPPPPPPIAQLEPVRGAVTVGREVQLDASASSDPTGRDLNYEWSAIVFPPDSRVQVPSDSAPELRFVPDVPGDYEIQVTVSSGEQSDNASVAFSAQAAPPPPARDPCQGLNCSGAGDEGRSLRCLCCERDELLPVESAWSQWSDFRVEGSQEYRVKWRWRRIEDVVEIALRNDAGRAVSCRVGFRAVTPGFAFPSCDRESAEDQESEAFDELLQPGQEVTRKWPQPFGEMVRVQQLSALRDGGEGAYFVRPTE